MHHEDEQGAELASDAPQRAHRAPRIPRLPVTAPPMSAKRNDKRIRQPSSATVSVLHERLVEGLRSDPIAMSKMFVAARTVAREHAEIDEDAAPFLALHNAIDGARGCFVEAAAFDAAAEGCLNLFDEAAARLRGLCAIESDVTLDHKDYRLLIALGFADIAEIASNEGLSEDAVRTRMTRLLKCRPGLQERSARLTIGVVEQSLRTDGINVSTLMEQAMERAGCGGFDVDDPREGDAMDSAMEDYDDALMKTMISRIA